MQRGKARRKSLLFAEMDFAGARFTFVFARQTITSFGDLHVHPLPDRQGKRKVQQRCQPPESGEPTTQIAGRLRSAHTLPFTSHNVHLFHQLVFGQIWTQSSGQVVVERKKSQPLPAIPAIKAFHLAPAKYALAVMAAGVFLQPDSQLDSLTTICLSEKPELYHLNNVQSTELQRQFAWFPVRFLHSQ